MNNFFKYLMVGAFSLIVISCGSAGDNKQSDNEVERIENVKVKTLEKVTIDREINVSTILEGYETVNISPSVTGTIEHIYVEVGSRVNVGDLLVRMDQNQLNTTKLTFANLSVEYDRVKVLNETGAVSQQNYDQTKLAYEQTKESLEFLQNNTFVKAPIKGVISAKNYEDGELYNGMPILTLTQTHQLKALISIPESYVPFIKEGMKIDIVSDIYPEEVFAGVIEIVYPTIDENTHTFQVKVKIANRNNKLRPGMYVRSTVRVGKVEAMMVPYQSVLKLTGSNERYVFIAKDGVAKRVRITMGKRVNDLVEVFSDDLAVGDQLVTVGQARLVEGVKLNVLK